tara:strand:+ start:447 stop:758 length:312 start_codon:yes stop_codon:yes gene_type:complete
MADDIYIKLVRNEKKNAPEQPDWVGPPNEESPPDKDWRIGVKIGDTWHNQAGWDDRDNNGEPTGMITVRLRSNDRSKSGSSGGGTPSFAAKKDYAKQSYYAKR